MSPDDETRDTMLNDNNNVTVILNYYNCFRVNGEVRCLVEFFDGDRPLTFANIHGVFANALIARRLRHNNFVLVEARI